MMEVLVFNPSKHLPDLYSWLGSRGISPPELHTIPKIGAVVRFNHTNVCMAFIRQVEGGYGQFDGLTSNPEMPAHIRHEALDLVINQVVKMSKDAGITEIMAFTQDKNTLTRAMKCGFTPFESFTVVSLTNKKEG